MDGDLAIELSISPLVAGSVFQPARAFVHLYTLGRVITITIIYEAVIAINDSNSATFILPCTYGSS